MTVIEPMTSDEIRDTWERLLVAMKHDRAGLIGSYYVKGRAGKKALAALDQGIETATRALADISLAAHDKLGA